MSSIPALEVQALEKVYSNNVHALRGISFSVEQGDFFALLGPNGAGKSTTIGIISSLVNKTRGEVRVFGYDMDKELPKAKQCIGLVPQEFNFNIFDTVLQVVVNQAGYYGVPRPIAMERAKKYLTRLGLWEKKDTPARFLSGGMKRRLMIARALLHEPRLLILDEPTAGVDIELRHTLWDFLKSMNEQGITIILTTHYLEEAESLCRHIAIIDQGTLIKYSHMRSLLETLHKETFVFYLRDELFELPHLPGFQSYLIDSKTLAVDLSQGQTLNDLFELFAQHHLFVTSMKNKINRLEELFLRLTQKEEQGNEFN
jgi:ABC-2 type transport system ATP-binding protein